MPHRQQILVLWLASADLSSSVCAWSRYDHDDHVAGTEDEPPYASAVAALRAGWRIHTLPEPFTPPPGHEYRCGHLRHRVVLEKILEPAHA
jgi:hypothetical protein